MDINTINLYTVEIDGVDPRDYPDFVDSYISYAEFKNGEILTSEELDELNDLYPEIAQERAFETLL